MKQWKVVALMLALWLFIVLYMTNSVPSSLESGTRAEQSLARALRELEEIHNQNQELQGLIAQLRSSAGSSLKPGQGNDPHNLQRRLDKASADLTFLSEKPMLGLTLEQEYARRKVENTARELWYFLEAQVRRMEASEREPRDSIEKLREQLLGYRRTMTDDFTRLKTANNGEDWRLEKSKEVGDLVQRRLEYLQNPKDCDSAKKVVCNLHKGCGFGCQLHHVTYCLIAAYAMQRTLILESKGWRYSAKGWETMFMPLSATCRSKGSSSKTHWGSSMSDMDRYQNIELPIVDSLHPKPEFMPLAIPADLAMDLNTFHGDPSVWWIGQFVKYLFRPNKALQEDLDSSGRRMGFKNTIVGVHVRRTDKLNLEASYHGIDEYMKHVADYYDQLERRQPGIIRRVYLASDDPSVLPEAKRKYPSYKFVSDNTISQSAQMGTRYTDNSLRGIILDIYFLSKSDYLVCTFSSQVCRVAYELMQTMHGDASQYFRSLDDVFYYGGQNAHDLKVLEEHEGDSDGGISMKPGDAVGIAGNHWDGFSKGTNRRTGMNGLYPSYKAENRAVAVTMPEYPQVPRKLR